MRIRSWRGEPPSSSFFQPSVARGRARDRARAFYSSPWPRSGEGGAGGGFLLALLLCCSVPAFAQGGIGAAVDFTRYSVDLDFDNAGVKGADIDEIGLTFSDRVAPALDLALEGGYSSADVDGLGRSLTGRFFGVLARYRPRLTAHVSLLAEVAYRHHKVDNGSTDHYAELKWYETELRLGPVFRTRLLEFAVGGYYQHFDGEHNRRGPSAASVDFGADSAGGAFASLSYYIDRTGRVGIFGSTGGRRGFGLIFSRNF